MSNEQTPTELPQKERLGCSGFIGILILVLAIAAVLFFLVVKPKLEERGVNVNEHVQQVQEKAREFSGELIEKTRQGAQDAAVEAGKWAEKSRQTASETVDKAADAAVKAADDIKESTSEIKEDLKEKVESWY